MKTAQILSHLPEYFWHFVSNLAKFKVFLQGERSEFPKIGLHLALAIRPKLSK